MYSRSKYNCKFADTFPTIEIDSLTCKIEKFNF